MLTKGLGNVRAVELTIELLVKVDTMSNNFKSINSSSAISPVESVVIKELAGCGVKIDTILSVMVSKLSTLVPVSSLPGTSGVLIRKETKVDVFTGELELVHQVAGIALVNSELLVSVNSNKSEADLLNIDVVDSRMSEDVVSIQGNRLNSRVVKSTVGVNGEVVVLVPGVSNDKTAREIETTIGLTSEDCIGNVLVSSLKDVINNR